MKAQAEALDFSRWQVLLRKAAIAGGKGFVEGAGKTALTDTTWDDGVGSGLRLTASGGARQATMDIVAASVDEYLDSSAWGQAWSKSDAWKRAAFAGVKDGLGDGSGETMGQLYDAATGKDVDPDAAFQEVLTKSLTGSVKGALQSLGKSWLDHVQAREDGKDLSVAPEQGTEQNPLQEDVVRQLAPSEAETRAAVEAQMIADGLDPSKLNTGEPVLSTDTEVDTSITMTVDADGTIMVDTPDGALVISPDGSTVIVGIDGATFGQDSSGTLLGEASGGTPAAVEGTDGTRALVDSDGTEVVKSPDGSASIQHPDGSVESTSNDAPITQADIDQLATTWASGGASEVGSSGNTFTFQDVDGSSVSVPTSDYDFVEQVRKSQKPDETYWQAAERYGGASESSW